MFLGMKSKYAMLQGGAWPSRLRKSRRVRKSDLSAEVFFQAGEESIICVQTWSLKLMCRCNEMNRIFLLTFFYITGYICTEISEWDLCSIDLGRNKYMRMTGDKYISNNL